MTILHFDFLTNPQKSAPKRQIVSKGSIQNGTPASRADGLPWHCDQTSLAPFRDPWFRLRLCARFVALKSPAPSQDFRRSRSAVDRKTCSPPFPTRPNCATAPLTHVTAPFRQLVSSRCPEIGSTVSRSLPDRRTTELSDGGLATQELSKMRNPPFAPVTLLGDFFNLKKPNYLSARISTLLR